MLKTRITAAIFGTVLFDATILGVAAQQATPEAPETTGSPAAAESGTTVIEPIVQTGGAEGLIAAVVQVADVIDITDSNIEIVTIEIEDSLNDITVLNDILNESPILNDNTIVITDVIEIGSIDNLIAIGILEGGDLILFKN